jgi:hypothetical protein
LGTGNHVQGTCSSDLPIVSAEISGLGGISKVERPEL